MSENYPPKSSPEFSLALPPTISPEVNEALQNNRPVVALDTTIFGQAGLGSEWPEQIDTTTELAKPNELCLNKVLNSLAQAGVQPALTAVIDGEVKIGLKEEEYPKILSTPTKAGLDHIKGVVDNQEIGTTTISSALFLAEHSGIPVLATSGIGGVHVEHSDRSSDLDALANYSVVTVAAGMKTFLDREATLEALEELGVQIIGWQTDDCPSFYSRSTGIKVLQANTAEEVINIAKNKWAKKKGGILLAVPIPEEYDIPLAEIQPIIDEANNDIAERGIEGPAVTPEVLKYMRLKFGNRLVEANLALAEQNAIIAAQVALAFSNSQTS
jgi:pseudouridylate synthase